MKRWLPAALFLGACVPPRNVHPHPVAADRITYFDGLNKPSVGQGKSGPSRPNPDAILQAIAAYENNSEPDLTPKLREWLFARGQDFIDAYITEPVRLEASPPQSLWHQAEAAYVAWLMARIPTLTEPEAAPLNLIARFTTKAVAYFPGLDHSAAGAAIADLWIKDGHPTNRNDSAFFTAFRETVCLPFFEAGRLLPRCGDDHGGWWYRDALATDEGAHHLAAALRKRNDADLTRNAALELVELRSSRTLVVVGDLEAADVWRDAVIAMGRAKASDWQKSDLTPYLQRAWKAYPERHGLILYALASSSGAVVDTVQEEQGPVDWVHFARDFGGGVTKADFAAFLDEAPRAIELARWLMRARTQGWSVAEVVLPRLEAYQSFPADEATEGPRGPGFVQVVDYLTVHEPAEAAKLTTHRTRQ